MISVHSRTGSSLRPTRYSARSQRISIERVERNVSYSPNYPLPPEQKVRLRSHSALGLYPRTEHYFTYGDIRHVVSLRQLLSDMVATRNPRKKGLLARKAASGLKDAVRAVKGEVKKETGSRKVVSDKSKDERKVHPKSGRDAWKKVKVVRALAVYPLAGRSIGICLWLVHHAGTCTVFGSTTVRARFILVEGS